MTPASTYRLQFGPGFSLARARRLVPYLHDLGVTHVYASPLLASRRGSSHGYDVVDPTQVDPELGGRRSLDALVHELHRRDMGMILDIVPNHMAASEENLWWRDVLARGEDSRHASVFDIDWDAGDGRVILPVLPEPGPDEVEGSAVRTYWRSGLVRLNYRRFFDITDLVGVRVEDPAVFEATHRLILDLVRTGAVDGLRIDHIDGLRDPAGYLRRLREHAGQDAFIVVEKILAHGEDLPRWPVEGTTGYEFLNMLNGVFVDPRGAEHLGRLEHGPDFASLVTRMKRKVLRELFGGELKRLARRGERRALVEVTAALAVYRTYIRSRRIPRRDRRVLDRAFREAGRTGVDLRELRDTLYLRRGRREDLEFVLRWQQLSGPAMAKGSEDTALYRHNRLVSLNEVGGECRPATVRELHRFLGRRRNGLSSTSTHDTKRSEDVRARIDVLSEFDGEWSALVRKWIHLAPDRSLGNLFFQTLVGAWPLDDADLPGYRGRLKAYLVKAAREAKSRTHWLRPDAGFEKSLDRFVDTVLDGPAGEAFRAFAERITVPGATVSLAQTTLKIAAPGVPDVYQGNELWDLSLVDPDNRRSVDFAARRRMLRALHGADPEEVRGRWRDGGVKMLVTGRGLRLRRRLPDLFARGRYLPLTASGGARGHVVAFARRHGRRWAVACVPRLMARRTPEGAFPVGASVWRDAVLDLPGNAPRTWWNAFTGERPGYPLRLAEMFATLPVALLVNQELDDL